MAEGRDWFGVLVSLMPPEPGETFVARPGVAGEEAYPGDYVAFVRAYGCVEIGEWLGVLAPEGAWSPDFPAGTVETAAEGMRDAWERTGPPDLVTRGCGFRPWGATGGGDTVGWLVDGPDPEAWRTLVGDRGREWRVYDCGMVEFLCRLLLVDRENPLDVPSYLRGTPGPRARHWRTLLAEALFDHDSPRTPGPPPVAGRRSATG